MLFNWLTKDNHGAYGSDLKHLGSISPSELVSLLSSLSLSPLSKNLLALLRLLFVISWKIDPGDCEKAINLERGKFLKELGKKITFDEFKSALHGIRERLQVLIDA